MFKVRIVQIKKCVLIKSLIRNARICKCSTKPLATVWVLSSQYIRIWEEVRDAWEEREQMGSYCKQKQTYSFSNLLWESNAAQGTLLLATVAVSHHTLAPVRFYSCNKCWSGGQQSHRRFAFHSCAKRAKRLRVSDKGCGRTILIVAAGTFSYRNEELEQWLSEWKS